MARSKKTQEAIDCALAAPQAKAQVGLGVDLVEIERMRKILRRTPSFAVKVFTEDERKYCEARLDKAIHFATRFAAKEAVLKALGTGFSNGISFRDVEVIRQPSKKPEIRLFARAAEVAHDLGVLEIPISLSYTKTDAICCAIAITDEAHREIVKKENSVEGLTQRFKELRSVLDDVDAVSVDAVSVDAVSVDAVSVDAADVDAAGVNSFDNKSATAEGAAIENATSQESATNA